MPVCVCSCVWLAVFGKEAEIQTNLRSVLENGAISWYTQQNKNPGQVKTERKKEERIMIFFLIISVISQESVGLIGEVASYFTLLL